MVHCMLNPALLIYRQFPIIITRSNNIYGPRQYTEKVSQSLLVFFQEVV